MRKVPIKEATELELREFARDTLGIEIKATATIETVRSRVRSAWNKDEIIVPDVVEPEQPVAAAPAQQVQQDGKDEREAVRLIIGVTEEAGGTDPVPIGVNGRVMLVPRGNEVTIPAAYFEVLENAVSHKYDSLPDGGINPVPRKVPLYPYQRVA